MGSMMKKAAITVAAAGAMAGVGIAPAAAASVTVSGGPSFTAVSTNSVLTSGSITISCTTLTKSGTFTPGTYTVPAQIGTITSASWSGCTAFGVPAVITADASASKPWTVWATSAQSGGNTQGEVRGIGVTAQVPSLGCTVRVTGTAPGVWSNTQTLTFTGGALTTSGSGFCLGLGSTGSISGSLNVTGSPSPISVL